MTAGVNLGMDLKVIFLISPQYRFLFFQQLQTQFLLEQ